MQYLTVLVCLVLLSSLPCASSGQVKAGHREQKGKLITAAAKEYRSIRFAGGSASRAARAAAASVAASVDLERLSVATKVQRAGQYAATAVIQAKGPKIAQWLAAGNYILWLVFCLNE